MLKRRKDPIKERRVLQNRASKLGSGLLLADATQFVNSRMEGGSNFTSRLPALTVVPRMVPSAWAVVSGLWVRRKSRGKYTFIQNKKVICFFFYCSIPQRKLGELI